MNCISGAWQELRGKEDGDVEFIREPAALSRAVLARCCTATRLLSPAAQEKGEVAVGPRWFRTGLRIDDRRVYGAGRWYGQRDGRRIRTCDTRDLRGSRLGKRCVDYLLRTRHQFRSGDCCPPDHSAVPTVPATPASEVGARARAVHPSPTSGMRDCRTISSARGFQRKMAPRAGGLAASSARQLPNRANTELASWVAVPPSPRCAISGAISRP